MNDEKKTEVVNIFLPPPEFLAKRLKEAEKDSEFRFDPLIHIPAEIPVSILPEDFEKEPSALTFPEEKLRVEMFTAGILNWLDKHRNGEQAPYFRAVARILRPDILAQLSEAALAKMQLQDWDTALGLTRLLSALFPGAPAIAHLEAEIKGQRSRYFAKTGLDEIAAASQEEADRAERREEARSFTSQIRTLIEENRPSEALEPLKEKLQEHPKAKQLWFLLGWTLRCLERWAEGEQALRKSVELAGDTSGTKGFVDAYNELAICLMEQGKNGPAREALEKALRRAPDNTKIMSNLGVLALREGKKDEAFAFFRTILDIDPEDPLAKHYLNAGK
jgi:tetratricopeptide (TPR) repeat protein